MHQFSALTLLRFQVPAACRCKKLAPSDALKPTGSNCLAYCCSLVWPRIKGLAFDPLAQHLSPIGNLTLIETPNASSGAGLDKWSSSPQTCSMFAERGSYGTSLVLPDQVPMRLESNPHAVWMRILCHQVVKVCHITGFAIHASGLSTVSDLNCQALHAAIATAATASMLHDVRVLCLLPAQWHV
ncbi:hypothetical protein AUEXF2481DRAFT_449974 [Aureobasidium subglaciale EXF-2481]|uniref:Uncharacterized protein n=1 Tax=Aureobasidium subglaciale (strain EXF-2481) TaxID=1043005 RepID=A0A074Y7I5_AURSE|nr:uncharacterized protein AUEXF2481DRAFT_449974 [Aureobasidium subglaciale EXF-2481]KAI5204000.1 hypothetical protein E4T38_04901 [Aureobasidium subglaciale]KAI5222840.1 hypothetical protein E4T40_04815 [Aureobasidium subglaciale]KAI5226617.1 hypothetical protein E4T41_04758 [Aureobasidium subglaciale]KAI5263096.1 hypothetical protein E4T46_04003 [Aureobasidium subglaciale]KEQ91949.1 hypothetical protein AUEXF2481DRAFT_449974 [Aureobasidium subglaciale EXF-2481]